MNQELAIITTEKTSLSTIETDLAGQLAPRTAKTYSSDIKHFADWLSEQGLSLDSVQRSDLIAYRNHLATSYTKSTAARMLSVTRRLFDEGVKRGDLAFNPAKDVKGFKMGRVETSHTALTKTEARAMLDRVDTNTVKGKRDFALLSILLRTGIRRFEAAALTIGDIRVEQGHNVANIEHGKGDQKGIVKLPVEVARAIAEYLTASGREQASLDEPLFVNFRKGDKPTSEALSAHSINEIVKQYSKGITSTKVTAHGLRASFITLTLEGGARLDQVQYAARHADPRTTERYQKRKLNLDDNAVDYFKL